MKILLISNMYPSNDHQFYGIFVKNFEKQLTQHGFEFKKAVIRGKGRSIVEKTKKYFQFFKDVVRLVKKGDYDIIYVHYIGHSLLPLLLVRHMLRKPLILNAHGADVFEISRFGLLIQKLVTPIIKSADLTVVPSNYFKCAIKEKFSIEPKKIFISPSAGVDTNIFKPNREKTKETFTVGFVSRIDKGKGWDIFLDSIYILKQHNCQLEVLMIGKGDEEKMLLEKIKKLSLSSIVNYVGAKPHDKLPHYFNQMDIFVFPTLLNESLGLVGLEAMACGIPVVGSNIGGLSGYIKDDVNGMLFEPGNSEELAKCIEEFMTMDVSRFQEYKVKALETGREYDSNVVANELAGKLRGFKCTAKW